MSNTILWDLFFVALGCAIGWLLAHRPRTEYWTNCKFLGPPPDGFKSWNEWALTKEKSGVTITRTDTGADYDGYRTCGNLQSDLRRLAHIFIDETPNLPTYVKPLAKEYAATHLNAFGNFLGVTELVWRRAEQKEDSQ